MKRSPATSRRLCLSAAVLLLACGEEPERKPAQTSEITPQIRESTRLDMVAANPTKP